MLVRIIVVSVFRIDSAWHAGLSDSIVSKNSELASLAT
jgi:hypothetical protein